MEDTDKWRVRDPFDAPTTVQPAAKCYRLLYLKPLMGLSGLIHASCPFEHWNGGFKSRSKHGCVSVLYYRAQGPYEEQTPRPMILTKCRKIKVRKSGRKIRLKGLGSERAKRLLGAWHLFKHLLGRKEERKILMMVEVVIMNYKSG